MPVMATTHTVEPLLTHSPSLTACGTGCGRFFPDAALIKSHLKSLSIEIIKMCNRVKNYNNLTAI
jgi:hypothetical protein